jgi:hypothetical protein
MKTISTVLLLLTLAACNTPAPEGKTGSENLLGLSFNYEKSELTATVVSNGCTMKEDFTIEQNSNQLTIRRKKRDECKALPEPVSISWAFKEAGIDPNRAYTIENNFIANPLTATIHEK